MGSTEEVLPETADRTGSAALPDWVAAGVTFLTSGAVLVLELAAPTPPEFVEGLELRPVSPAVNSVKNNGVELTAGVESVAAPADQPALF